jgi:hypothetical protein
MKILSITAELFHVERQTDMTKLLVASRNFANKRKNKPRFYGKSLCQLRKALFFTFLYFIPLLLPSFLYFLVKLHNVYINNVKNICVYATKE